MKTGATSRSPVRRGRERLIQTLWLEVGGVLIVAPLFARLTAASLGDSLIALVALSGAVMCWSALFNTVFDRLEFRFAHRVASDRPPAWRLLHTLAHELSAVVVSWPLIVALTPLGWGPALVADVGLTLAYAVYGFLFHLGFDRVRPIRSAAPSKRRRTHGNAST